jgi:hypothetical protein
LYGVYQTLRERKEEVGGIELLEFDKEEYKTLLRLGRQIVDSEINTKENRLVFLALAIAHARRYNLTTENAFWDKFEEVLELRENEKRSFITEHLLWTAYSEEGIQRKRTEQTRRFVGTLLRVALKNSRLRRNQLLDFFEWYYETGPERAIDNDLVRKYERDRDTELRLFRSSLQGLQRHCNLLRNVLDYAIEEELFLRDVDYDTYQKRIQNALGEEYDFDRYHLLSNPDALQRVVVRLENHRTPRQFRQLLKGVSQTASVQLPSGKKWRVNAFRRYDSDIPYGTYHVDGKQYRVVPRPWIRLQSIRRWEPGEVVSLRRSGYVGYRNDEAFDVRRGHRRDTSHPCYFSGHEQTHVWAGPVEPGRPLVIDGTAVEGSTGISWSTDMQVGRDEDDAWVMRLVLPRLDVFLPDRPGQKITLRYAGRERSYTLDSRGTCSLRRATAFLLKPHESGASLTLCIRDEVLKEKPVEVESSYLFSLITYGRIPAGTEREWGDQRYLLFTRHPNDLETSDSIETERLDASFSDFSIIKVHWHDPEQPFSLSCRDRSWEFERSRYFSVQCSRLSEHDDPFEFDAHQVCRLTDVRLDLQTNHPLRDLDLRVEASLDDSRLGEFAVTRSDQVSPTTLQEIDERRQGRTGHVGLYFYLDDQLVASQRLSVLPKVRVDAATPLHTVRRVGETFPVRVRTDDAILWNPDTGERTSSRTFRCSTTADIDASRGRPDGIHNRVPSSIRKRLYLPEIDEAFYLRFTPSIFGLWTFETSGDEYQETSLLDYYRLGESALLVRSTPGSKIRILAPKSDGYIQLRDATADDDGSLLIENLSFFASQCSNEHSTFYVESESCQIPVHVRWAPRLHASSIQGSTVKVCASGPPDTDIIATWKSEHGEVTARQFVSCDGDQFAISFSTDKADSVADVLLQFRHSDGEKRSAKRHRLSQNREPFDIPEDWLAQGIGVSDSEVFRLGG